MIGSSCSLSLISGSTESIAAQMMCIRFSIINGNLILVEYGFYE